MSYVVLKRYILDSWAYQSFTIGSLVIEMLKEWRNAAQVKGSLVKWMLGGWLNR